MKTKHITLAILAAASAGAFSAAYADDTSGVVISGFVRAGVESLNSNANYAWGNNSTTAANATRSSATGVWGRSQINFNGSENLGNGLSAVFQVNNRFSTTGNGYDDQHGAKAGTFASDDTFVGVKSDSWGEIRLGKGTGNTEDGKYDNTYVVGPDQILGYFGGVTDNNMVRYDLPNFGALYSSVQYSTDENKTTTTSATQRVSVNVGYDVGQWGVSGAYGNKSNVVSPFGWSNRTGTASLTDLHFTASYKPIDALQLAVELQRESWNSQSQTKSALYAYYTINNVQLGLQGGVQTFSGDKIANLKNGKFVDAFVHYALSKQTTVYFEAVTDRDGSSAIDNNNTVVSGARNVFIVGLRKGF
ncbi:porin [Paludibacterium yongneupense]|uniref:porin n=1 Tax=Paludibacterium yongneupense TaxID=400061 RepID=UPI00041342F1|nr:porin [Paludibacterium yongneupense]